MYYNIKSSANESASLITGLNKVHEATLNDVLDIVLQLKVHYNVHKSILMDTLMIEKNQVHLHILLL
jgi:hypothetical protein